MSSFEDPVVISCSISGVIANRDQCPAIPYTPEEYAAEARRAVDEGASQIHIQPAQIVTPHGKQRFAQSPGNRLLGDTIDHTACGTATVESGRRPLEHLDAFHVAQIPEIQAVITHAVYQSIARGIEAANVKLIAPSLPLRDRDAADIAQHLLHFQCPLLPNQLLADHLHRLRHIAQGHIELGGDAATAIDRIGNSASPDRDRRKFDVGGMRQMGKQGRDGQSQNAGLERLVLHDCFTPLLR